MTDACTSSSLVSEAISFSLSRSTIACIPIILMSISIRVWICIIKTKFGRDFRGQIKYLEYHTCMVQKPFELSLQFLVYGIPEHFLHPMSTGLRVNTSTNCFKFPVCQSITSFKYIVMAYTISTSQCADNDEREFVESSCCFSATAMMSDTACFARASHPMSLDFTF